MTGFYELSYHYNFYKQQTNLLNKDNKTRTKISSYGKVPGSKGCTLDTFNGMYWIRRRRFDKTSSASSKLPENDIGSNDITTFLLQSIEQFQEKRTIKRIGKI